MRTSPERFGISNSYEITQLSKFVSETELLDVMDRVIEEDISTRALAKMRASAQEGKGRKLKEACLGHTKFPKKGQSALSKNGTRVRWSWK